MNRFKLVVGLSIVTLFVVCTFLFAKKPEKGSYHKYVAIKNIGFVFNTDSMTFIEGSLFTERIFQKGFPYQLRPVFLYSAKGLGVIIKWFVLPFEKTINIESRAGAIKSVKGTAKSSQYLTLEHLCVYFAYIILNFVILVAVMWMFIFTSSIESKITLSTCLLSLFMLLNGVVKMGFWTPHTYLFSFLVPSVSIYLSCFFSNKTNVVYSKLLLSGMIVSMLMLAYSSFILAVVCVATILLLELFSSRDNQEKLRILGKSCFWLFVCLVPVMLWKTVINLNGEFYSHEMVVYRQFVWVIDACKSGMLELLKEAWDKLTIYAKCYFNTGGLTLFTLLCCAGYIYKKNITFTEKEKKLLIASTIYIVFASGFFYVLGYYGWRFIWHIVPANLIFIAFLVNKLVARKSTERYLNLILVILILIQWIKLLLYSGPFL